MNTTLMTKRSKTVGTLLQLLESKAKQSSQSFMKAVQGIDWSLQPPELFLRAIDLALALEMATVASQLAKDGFRQFPNHSRLQSAYSVLLPAKAQVLAESDKQDVVHSMRELNVQAEKYRGQWVAFKAGQLLAAAATLKMLRSQIEAEAGGSILITRVL